MARHFPACTGDVDITAVAGQIRIFDQVQPPIDSNAPIVVATDSPWQEAGIISQKDDKKDCPWAASGAGAFLTECNGRTFARYLYATQWDGDSFSTGTRRNPVEDPERCWGDSWAGGDPAHGYMALGVPYNPDLDLWPLERAVKAFNIVKSTYRVVENYTACFPMAKDGEMHIKPLPCDGYDNLFVLNGLGGGGIARGPAAGRRVAQHVAAALGHGEAPEEDVKLYSGANIVLAWVLGFSALVLVLLACCCSCACCFDYLELDEDFRGEVKRAARHGRKLGPLRVRVLKTARRRRAACVAACCCTFTSMILAMLAALTAIAWWEMAVFFAPYLLIFIIVNIVLIWCAIKRPAELARRCFCCFAVDEAKWPQVRA